MEPAELEQIRKFISDSGYGSGTNLTINSTAYLIYHYGQSQICDDVNEPTPSSDRLLSLLSNKITEEEINAFTSKGITGGDRRGRKEGIEWIIKKLLR